MKIHESGENYLETILMLKNRIGQVRSIDIVREMDFSKPTVSVAMKRFRENGYITMDGEGYISLTPKGQEIAERIYERHVVIAEILMKLGVPEKTAYEDSCRIEHDLSDDTFARIKEHYYKHKASIKD
ncbi:MAG TPA: metal-dependent transcriptional regulator [Firmicutes bacterium]|nr:metal-dependent transcriptional regulator [Bacillota bacterium]